MNGLILCTSECNLRCKYCFEKPFQKNDVINNEIIRSDFNRFLDKSFDKFMCELIDINREQKRETSITFHGGEPLLVGYDLLKKAFERLPKQHKIKISTQTNGTLITDEIIELFKEFNVNVGISIDGEQHMHDAFRKDIKGEGTFERVYANLKKLQSAGIVVGALATVTDITIKDYIGFYDFFKKNNLSFSFNPCFSDAGIPLTYKPLDMSSYIDITKKLFDLWINDTQNNISITCFDRILSAMSVKNRIFMEVCTYIPDCSRTTVAINTNGEFYRCLHYCMHKQSKLGDIYKDSLYKALDECDISKRWDVLRNGECKNCDIQDFCCGGCPYVAEANNGNIMTKANTCVSQQSIVRYINSYLKQFIKEKSNVHEDII